jgi:hypothetical protein
MKKVEFFKKIMIWALVLLLSVPIPLFAQGNQVNVKKFSQEQLDQMLAPIALYPDALLAQVLMASTYPLEVVMADRWVRENQDLKGDQLNNALDRELWDVSVKALVPFPAVLAMMSEKMEWTQMVGNAFLAQEEDVMATVQQLRQRAYDAGNLTNTEQQLVTRENDIISIVPSNPTVVYVPVYDPWWVFGPWWWPAYPPYVVYPYRSGVVIAPGFIWFGTGFFVGAFWGSAWGHWDWHHHHVYINTNRQININRPDIKTRNMKTRIWIHDPVHRRGVVYPNKYTRERFGKRNQNEVKNRRLYRGFNRVPGGDVNKAEARIVRSGNLPDRQAPRKAPAIRSGSLPGRQVPREVPTVRAGSSTGKQVPRTVPVVRPGSLPERQTQREVPAVRSGSSTGKQVPRKVPAVRSGSLPDKQVPRTVPVVRPGSLPERQTQREVPAVRSGSSTGKQVPRKVPVVRSGSSTGKQVPRKVPVVRSGSLPERQAPRKIPIVRSGSLPERQVSREVPAVRSGSLPGRGVVRSEGGRDSAPGRFDAARGVGFRRGRP